jgi:hypothetical protein
MKLIKQKFALGITIFTICILLSIIEFIIPNPEFLGWFICGISLIYLLFGWYFFKGYYPDGPPLLLFLIGYLYSGIFIALTFWVKNWSGVTMFIYVTPLYVLALTIILIVNKKKIPRQGFIQFWIETGLLLILSIMLFMLDHK